MRTEMPQFYSGYTPVVERRAHVCVDTPGLQRVRSMARERFIAHDREFMEPREGFHSALLLDHSEGDRDVAMIVGETLGFTAEEVFLIGDIGFHHDLSKTKWHGHRIDGPLPPSEIQGKDAHACMSQIMYLDIGRLCHLDGDEWLTLETVGVGIHFHHTPEDLARIAERTRRVRELKLVTTFNVVDFYVGVREARGKSHPATSHVAAIAETLKHVRKSRFDFARSEVEKIVAALDQPAVEERVSLYT